MGDEKPHKPSKRKLEKARRDGKVLRCRYFVSVFSLLAAVVALQAYLAYGWVGNKMLLEYCLLGGFRDVQGCGAEAVGISVKVACVGIGTSAVVSTLLQLFFVGGGVFPGLALPQFERLDPFAGVQRMFKGLKDIPFLTACVGIFGTFFTLFVQDLLRTRDGIVWLPLHGLGIRMSCVAFVIGGFDLWRRRRQYFRELGMSHDELRQELRDDEGDPHIRARRRALHAALSREEMVARIRRSRVVVVRRAS